MIVGIVWMLPAYPWVAPVRNSRTSHGCRQLFVGFMRLEHGMDQI